MQHAACGASSSEALTRSHPAEQAKNLVPDSGGRATKVGEKVVELQRLLPNARVVYCSATGSLLLLRMSRAWCTRS
jgi:P-loop containing NTP hydrolase pore-1